MPLTWDYSHIFLLGLLSFGGVGFVLWQRSQSQLARFMDLSIEGMVLSHNGVIVEVNQRAIHLFGCFSRHQLIGKNLLELVAPESLTLVEAQLRLPRVDTYECMLQKCDGTAFCALIRGTTVMKNEKSLRVTAFLDLSELKQSYCIRETNAQLMQQIEKNKQQAMVLIQQSRHAQMGEMISMIAHQWRQPLNILSLMTQNIVFKYKMKALDDTLMDMFKEDAMRQISQMSKTVDDFRDFFRPDKTKKVFDVKKQLLHVIQMVKPLYTMHRIELLLEVDEGLKLESYPNEFNQCMITLLNNAKDVLIKAHHVAEKFIIITAFINDAGRVVILVEDNGGGIDEKIVAHLFEPYVSTKEAKRGTGLGLYMTKMIVEEHMQGKISATNAQGGARFEIIL